jgi:cation:H+ antiporter
LCLIKGGDWFVDGSTGLARRFHVPELLIGATIVSIGTTLPEVMVSTTSALSGHGEIAYGNAIGSVICNAALVAAVTIAVRPGKVDAKSLKTPVAFFFVAALIYAITAYTSGYFGRGIGLVLLAMFVAYMVITVLQMKNSPAEIEPEEEETDKPTTLGRELLLLVVGAALIAVGANLLVDNGTLIAAALGVPESVIALTFVALGTSLPELVTAITSLIKGHSALSLGNVIGANLFNLVLVSGVSVTLAPFSIPQNATIAGYNASLVLDLPVMFLVMLLLTVPALARGKLTRVQGVLLLAIYFAFCAVQFTL